MSNWLGHAFEGLLGHGNRGDSAAGQGWVHRHAAEGRGFLAGAALVGLLAMVQQHSTVAAQTAAEVRLEAVAGAMAEYARELHDLGINDGEQIDALHRLTAQLDGTLDPLAADDATGDGWIAARTELALRPASND